MNVIPRGGRSSRQTPRRYPGKFVSLSDGTVLLYVNAYGRALNLRRAGGGGGREVAAESEADDRKSCRRKRRAFTGPNKGRVATGAGKSIVNLDKGDRLRSIMRVRTRAGDQLAAVDGARDAAENRYRRSRPCAPRVPLSRRRCTSFIHSSGAAAPTAPPAPAVRTRARTAARRRTDTAGRVQL